MRESARQPFCEERIVFFKKTGDIRIMCAIFCNARAPSLIYSKTKLAYFFVRSAALEAALSTRGSGKPPLLPESISATRPWRPPMLMPAKLARNVVQALRRLCAVNFLLQLEHRDKKGANFVMRLVFSK